MDVNSELKDAQLEIRDADNAYNNNQKGLVWFNRALNKVKMIFNSDVKIIATEDWVTDQVSNSEDSLKGAGLITDEQVNDPSAPAVDTRRIFAKNDGVYDQDSDGNVEKLATDTRVTEVENASISKTAVNQVVNISQGNTQIITAPFNALCFPHDLRDDADQLNTGPDVSIEFTGSLEGDVIGFVAMGRGVPFYVEAGKRIRIQSGDEARISFYFFEVA